MQRIAYYLRHATVGLRHDLLMAFFAILGTLALIPIITYLYFAQDLQTKEKIMNKNNQGITLFDRENKPFFTFYQAKKQTEISLSDIPKITQQAFIATEDRDFYSHDGFSIKSILRSFRDDLEQKQLAYGGSTITQQLVKNSLLTPRKEFLRKIQEIVLAQEIDRRYSKDEILQMYLNSVYLGEGAFGVEEGSLTYFNKRAKDLNLAESSMLAAILPAPSRLSLISGDFNQARKRQKIVLDKMVEQKYINQKKADEALEKGVAVTPHAHDLNSVGIHFALMVKDQLTREYGEENVARYGFKVRTSLDLDWQKYAEKVVADQVEKLKVNKATNGAALVLDPRTGEIRVMVGSKDWYEGKYGKVNIALSARPPGSAFKPIVYIRALEKQLITPATILHDAPTRFANFNEEKYFASWPTRAQAMQALARDPNAFYSPKDFDGKFRGPVTVRRALSNSLNVPAVEVMKKVGVDDVVNFAKNLGISTLGDPSNYGLSLVLGAAEVEPLELTNVYATFANKGYRNDPASILEIKGKSGNTIYKYQANPQKVIEEKYTFLISSILSDNETRKEEFGNALTISRTAAVKTGTTEDFKDAWTIGYTPSLVVGVWVGNNFGEAMDGVAGSLGAAPIWKDLMEKFLKGTSVEKFEPPSDIVSTPICANGLVARIVTPSAKIEYFEKGTEPKQYCNAQISLEPVYYMILGD